MHTRMRLVAMAASALTIMGLYSANARAQTRPDAPITREEFERRLQEIERRHEEDLAARDREIAALRRELDRRPPTPVQTELDRQRAEATQDTLDKMLADIEASRPAPATQRVGINFNPNIAVISDFLGTWSDNRRNDAWNRFDVGEVELDIRAAVHPKADAVAILAIARDVENPPFPGDEPPEGPETSIVAEEVYLFLHNFGIPNLTAKLGRFHVRFGRQNLLHLHDLPTSDPPLVNQSFLAPEALSDAGLSLSYVIPNPWNQYFEIVAEILAGEGGSSESPTLSGDLSVDSPATNLHLLWNTDIARDWNLEIGGSWLHGHADADNALDVDLLGGDLTLLHIDPSGGFNNQVFQAEFIHGIVDQMDGATQRAWGMYVLGQQQLNKDWYLGTRFDWTQNANDQQQELWAISPYVSWYWSEFLRFRLEYQHHWGDVTDEHVVFFQVTWVFGAHPPEPYWRFR